jgi:hypothetical protein
MAAPFKKVQMARPFNWVQKFKAARSNWLRHSIKVQMAAPFNWVQKFKAARSNWLRRSKKFNLNL